MTKNLSFPYLEAVQGNFKLYCFVSSAKQLWEILDINRRNTDKETGYQRVLSTSRVNKITRYVNEGNAIPNNLLISLDKARVSKGKLLVPNVPSAGWVIDGQHRLAGAAKADKDIDFLVIALLGLTLEDQIKLFVDINREQKGVPTSLYFDLLSQLPPKTNDAEVAKERASNIARELARDENSPFFGRIVFNPPKRGEISITNFVRKISPLLAARGKFGIYTLKEQNKILDNYFKALENIFPLHFKTDNYTFFKTLGFGAIINVLPTVFDLSLKQHNSFTVSAGSEVLKTVNYFDFSKWNEFGTGSAAEILAGDDLREELLGANNVQDGGSIEL